MKKYDTLIWIVFVVMFLICIGVAYWSDPDPDKTHKERIRDALGLGAALIGFAVCWEAPYALEWWLK